MAAAKSFIEEYTELLMCPICLDTVKTPKSLKCLHSFCEGCLDEWIQTEKDSRKKNYPCPVCKCDTDIPNGGANSYRTNFTMKSMAEALERTKKQLNESSINCDICVQDDQHTHAVARCIECAEYLCNTCDKSHGRMRSSKSHKHVKLTGDTEKDSKIAIDCLVQRNIDCTEHSDQPLKFYCKTDKAIVCRDCCITDHSGHSCVKIEDVAKEEIRNVSALIGLAIQRKNLLEKQLKISDNLTETQGQKLQKLLSSIKSDRRAMQSELDKYFNKQERDAKEAHNNTLKQVESRRTDIELKKGITESTLLHLMSLQKHGHPVEIVNSSADIKQTLQDWSSMPLRVDSEHQDKSLDIGTYKPGHLDISQLGHIVTSTDKASVKASATSLQCKESPKLCMPNLHRTEHLVDKKSESCAIQDICVGENQNILVVEYPENKPKFVTYEINPRSLNKKSTKEINSVGVCTTKDNCYAICDLTNKCVAIYNQNLVHKRNIGTFKHPHRLCMNSKGELLVTDFAVKCVYIVDCNNGSILGTIGDGVLEKPRFLTTNSKYAVIVSDEGGHSVKMFNRKGDLLNTYGTKGSGNNQLHQPFGVCTDSLDNIFIADNGNSRIHMLDPTGKFIKYLLTPEDNAGRPAAVAIDHNGDLLVGTGSGDLHFIKYMAYQ
ncbi:unnamed protein product [Owenia fusiformis]|uniref:Tripartite motif-containing protein 2-like n=1 Tax=Owenia fusiformis TaxID=6347 RepID=A0A8S4NPH9_OWEFU|nr:unnamed protein product [Owenia fusiformis]